MHGVGVFNQYLIRFQFGGFPFAHKLSEAEQPGLKIAHFYLPVLIFDALDNGIGRCPAAFLYYIFRHKYFLAETRFAPVFIFGAMQVAKQRRLQNDAYFFRSLITFTSCLIVASKVPFL